MSLAAEARVVDGAIMPDASDNILQNAPRWWSSVAGKMIETVWPGISELRTTAFRAGQYAGMPEPDFGPTIEHTFKGQAGRGKSKGQERSLTLQFPEWCRVTITRELNEKERSFVGPKVFWFEAYAKWADTDVPNEMWANRPVGQLEKCAEAGALRRAFPEEIGNALTAEEMEGQPTFEGAAHAPEKPKPESVTPPSAGGERKLPPLVSQAQSLTASSSAELPEPRQEGDLEIPHPFAHPSE
jgi:phage recombination protein Bet